ncbi:hypothetical protein AAHE18_08G217700 [Arachis hypogaea]
MSQFMLVVCVRIRCLSGDNRPCKGDIIEVKVVDLCHRTPCPTMLLSTTAFSAISRFSNAKINIEYAEI